MWIAYASSVWKAEIRKIPGSGAFEGAQRMPRWSMTVPPQTTGMTCATRVCFREMVRFLGASTVGDRCLVAMGQVQKSTRCKHEINSSYFLVELRTSFQRWAVLPRKMPQTFAADLATSRLVMTHLSLMPIPFDPVPRPKPSRHQQVDDIDARSRDNTSAR